VRGTQIPIGTWVLKTFGRSKKDWTSPTPAYRRPQSF